MEGFPSPVSIGRGGAQKVEGVTMGLGGQGDAQGVKGVPRV